MPPKKKDETSEESEEDLEDFEDDVSIRLSVEPKLWALATELGKKWIEWGSEASIRKFKAGDFVLIKEPDKGDERGNVLAVGRVKAVENVGVEVKSLKSNESMKGIFNDSASPVDVSPNSDEVMKKLIDLLQLELKSKKKIWWVVFDEIYDVASLSKDYVSLLNLPRDSYKKRQQNMPYLVNRAKPTKSGMKAIQTLKKLLRASHGIIKYSRDDNGNVSMFINKCLHSGKRFREKAPGICSYTPLIQDQVVGREGSQTIQEFKRLLTKKSMKATKKEKTVEDKLAKAIEPAKSKVSDKSTKAMELREKPAIFAKALYPKWANSARLGKKWFESVASSGQTSSAMNRIQKGDYVILLSKGDRLVRAVVKVGRVDHAHSRDAQDIPKNDEDLKVFINKNLSLNIHDESLKEAVIRALMEYLRSKDVVTWFDFEKVWDLQKLHLTIEQLCLGDLRAKVPSKYAVNFAEVHSNKKPEEPVKLLEDILEDPYVIKRTKEESKNEESKNEEASLKKLFDEASQKTARNLQSEPASVALAPKRRKIIAPASDNSASGAPKGCECI